MAKKLSLKPGLRAWWEDMPASVEAEIGETGIERLAAPDAPIDAAHIFVTRRADMEARLTRLRPLLASAGFIWVSWPKKASKVPTDITEDAIREACGIGRAPGTALDGRGQSSPARLPSTDLVDVKVCAIDEIWSGLKLMIRKERR
ncbi:MAG TPA: hypothetical protein VLK25_09010 [Allosphingosinicella sp.]|nr:hypothetical protein [Allosphingosinicella sp.]